jgi:hypothetical protein
MYGVSSSEEHHSHRRQQYIPKVQVSAYLLFQGHSTTTQGPGSYNDQMTKLCFLVPSLRLSIWPAAFHGHSGVVYNPYTCLTSLAKYGIAGAMGNISIIPDGICLGKMIGMQNRQNAVR